MHRGIDPIVLNDNGAWSWFEDERAIVDVAGGKLLVSSVASADGTGGVTRQGNVEVVAYDLATGHVERAVLHPHLQADDHDSAALYVRPDGRYVAMYSKHATDSLSRWRVSSRPAMPRTGSRKRPWTTVRQRRTRTCIPLIATARSMPSSALPGAILMCSSPPITVRRGAAAVACSTAPGDHTSAMPPDGSGRIHLVTTNQHPLDFANRIYHGAVAGHELQRSDGTVTDEDVFDGVAAPPDRLTEVYRGTEADRAWTVDLQVDEDDRAVHRVLGWHRCRTRQTQPLEAGGTPSLLPRPLRRLRLVGAVPRLRRHRAVPRRALLHRFGRLASPRPQRVFVSTDVHPHTGVPLISATDGLQHHELFEGVTTDGSAWTWSPITANSTVDNIRPVVPVWEPGHTALLWLRGTYTSYQRYDLDVVGMVTSDR